MEQQQSKFALHSKTNFAKASAVRLASLRVLVKIIDPPC